MHSTVHTNIVWQIKSIRVRRTSSVLHVYGIFGLFVSSICRLLLLFARVFFFSFECVIAIPTALYFNFYFSRFALFLYIIGRPIEYATIPARLKSPMCCCLVDVFYFVFCSVCLSVFLSFFSHRPCQRCVSMRTHTLMPRYRLTCALRTKMFSTEKNEFARDLWVICFQHSRLKQTKSLIFCIQFFLVGHWHFFSFSFLAVISTFRFHRRQMSDKKMKKKKWTV